jgi:D-alanyl-D-alanine carboxypeptidase (penicillin-binding protein 5/6)
MADKARQLGALDTRPATPSGLDGPGMATSAYDLAVLFRHAMGEPLFAETIATREIPFPGYGDRPGFILSNANPLLARYPGTLGSKTGFTDAARHTIVAAAERNGRRMVVSLVRAENTPVVNWRQATALLDYGFALPADAPAVGTLVDAAPAALTASAGTAGPAGTFTGPVTTGLHLPGGVTLSGGTTTIAGAAGTVVAVMLLAMALLRTRRRQPAGPSARHRHR